MPSLVKCILLQLFFMTDAHREDPLYQKQCCVTWQTSEQKLVLTIKIWKLILHVKEVQDMDDFAYLQLVNAYITRIFRKKIMALVEYHAASHDL